MKTIRVIIAEDDPQITEIQKRFLSRISGFELVGVAHDIEEAKDIIDVMKPDLLLLDIQFPSGTGLDLLKDLRSKDSNIDIILITASKEVNTLRAALRGGIFDYILKPLVFERLKETLCNYQNQTQKLQSVLSIDQSDVDVVLPRKNKLNNIPQREDRLPKGIDALTLKKIREIFTQSEEKVGMSAEEVGEIIGASRTTARRYLEHLVAVDVLQAEVSYGNVGRPERKYNLA